jgi:hypothetical protein
MGIVKVMIMNIRLIVIVLCMCASSAFAMDGADPNARLLADQRDEEAALVSPQVTVPTYQGIVLIHKDHHEKLLPYEQIGHSIGWGVACAMCVCLIPLFMWALVKTT